MLCFRMVHEVHQYRSEFVYAKRILCLTIYSNNKCRVPPPRRVIKENYNEHIIVSHGRLLLLKECKHAYEVHV